MLKMCTSMYTIVNLMCINVWEKKTVRILTIKIKIINKKPIFIFFGGPKPYYIAHTQFQ